MGLAAAVAEAGTTVKRPRRPLSPNRPNRIVQDMGRSLLECPGHSPSTTSAPYAFGATPDLVLLEGDCDAATRGDGDFDIAALPISGTGTSRHEATLTVPYRGLTQDTWFVVVVRGSDGVCEPMFPVYASGRRSSSSVPTGERCSRRSCYGPTKASTSVRSPG